MYILLTKARDYNIIEMLVLVISENFFRMNERFSFKKNRPAARKDFFWRSGFKFSYHSLKESSVNSGNSLVRKFTLDEDGNRDFAR